MDFLKRLFQGDKVIWIVYMFLCFISIVEVFSAASTLTYKSGDHWAPITQHITYLTIGTCIVLGMHRIHYRWFSLFPPFLIALALVLLLYLTAKGVMVNGAARWIEICGIRFQPSEIGKMGVIMGTALILSRTQEEENASRNAMKYVLYISLPVCFLIFRENGSTALLLFGVVILMMFIGRVPMIQLGKLMGVLIAIVTLFFLVCALVPTNVQTSISGRLPTMQSRILDFNEDKNAVTPEEFDIDKDAQKAHAHIAIASSHIIGKLPGNSVERDFLSQAFSDFIYAIIIEELGLLGGFFVLFLYMVLLIRVYRIARKCNSNFPKLLIIGIALLIVSQALINMMVAVGLFPITGQPLPLISKGGTSTLINCAYIGMILSVSRYVNKMEEKQAAQAEAEREKADEMEEKEFADETEE